MSTQFNVNGKVYLQSSTLAASCGYTSDYLGKLAREEKVLGSLVGRQWFIEPESLKVFLHKTKIEKEIRQEELSIERKLAHSVHAKSGATSKTKSPTLPRTLDVIAQTFVIVFCGFFLGGLGVVVNTENIGTNEILSGAQENLGNIVKAVIPSQQTITKNMKPDSSVAASTEGILEPRLAPQKHQEVFATLPVLPLQPSGQTFFSTSTNQQDVEKVIFEFSDEVRVVIDQGGNRFIEPIFKTKVESPQRFMVVPVPYSEN